MSTGKADMTTILGSNDIEIYTSEQGYACIKQHSEVFQDEVVVLIRPNQLLDVIGALQALHVDRG
jgi:hypothetical protein